MGPVRHAIEARAQEIAALVKRRHATSIRLFGSAARMDDAAASDADFLVDLGPDASILDVVHLRLDLERLLSLTRSPTQTLSRLLPNQDLVVAGLQSIGRTVKAC